VTECELEVAQLTAAGLQDREIAEELGISVRAVKERKLRAARRIGYNGKRLDVALVRGVRGNTLSSSYLEMFAPHLRPLVELAVRGMTNPEIAKALGLAFNTVRNYMKEIFDIAGVWNRRGLAGMMLCQVSAADIDRSISPKPYANANQYLPL